MLMLNVMAVLGIVLIIVYAVVDEGDAENYLE
jgi:hypothetical protein